jgi:uncharacterized protein (DUF362 family)
MVEGTRPMTELVRRRKWTLMLAILCLVTGLGMAKRPDRADSEGYSLVETASAETAAGTPEVGVVASDYEQLEKPASRDAVLTEAQVEDMVREAVAMAGGLRQRIEPDAERIVIKVNIVELRRQGSGVITDFRVVKALIRMLHEIVPKARVTIVEGPGDWVLPDSPPAELRSRVERADGFALAGYKQLLDDPELAGVDLELLDTNFDAVSEVSVPGGGYARDDWKLPVTILESDFLISVPVLKIHAVISMTNAMKNLVGIAPGMVYGWPKLAGYPPRSGNPGIPHTDKILDETIADLVTMARPDFALVDAIMCMERAKSDKYDGSPVRVNAVLAGADVVAVDAISAQLIGLNPFDLEYLTLAASRGLGQCDPDRIKVNGSPLSQVTTRLEKAPSGRGRGHYGQGNRTWVLQGPFTRTGDEAAEEFIDVSDPRALAGQNGWSQAVYFHDDRIDLDKYYDDPFNCAVYAYAEFEASTYQAAEMWVGSDEGLKVWINGDQVYAHEGRRRHRLPNDRQTIQVQEGRNTVLVRADQRRSGYDFSLNICEPETDGRYDGSRVRGLKFSVPTGSAQVATDDAEIRVEGDEGDGTQEGAVMLDGVTVPRMDDRLLGTLAGGLKHLGQEADPVQLMGLSGHAFRFSMADSLDWRGVGRIDLERMARLYGHLGYEVRVIQSSQGDPDFLQKQEEAWDAVVASIDRGAPVVARLGWGHRLIVGYHAKKEQYYATSSRGETGQYRVDEVGTSDDNPDAGLEVLLLGEQLRVDRRVAVRAALQFAIEEAHRPDQPGTPYHNGFRGFECWIADIEAGRVESERQLGYANEVVLNARVAAAEYLPKLAAGYAGRIASDLHKAAECYAREAESFQDIAEIFPNRGRAQADLGDPQVQKRVADLVRAAYTWDRKAVALLEEALAQMP